MGGQRVRVAAQAAVRVEIFRDGTYVPHGTVDDSSIEAVADPGDLLEGQALRDLLDDLLAVPADHDVHVRAV